MFRECGCNVKPVKYQKILIRISFIGNFFYKRLLECSKKLLRVNFYFERSLCADVTFYEFRTHIAFDAILNMQFLKLYREF